MSQIENAGAIVDNESGTRVTFDLNPESFQDNKDTEFAGIDIPGMSHPNLNFLRYYTKNHVLNHGDKATPSRAGGCFVWLHTLPTEIL